MKICELLAVLVLLTVAPNCRAVDGDGRYAVYGGKTCWDYIVWLDVKDTAEVGKLEAWVGGYVTAYNMQTPETITILGGADLKAAMHWLAQWCRANPKSSIDVAMNALTKDFYPRRLKSVKEAAK